MTLAREQVALLGTQCVRAIAFMQQLVKMLRPMKFRLSVPEKTTQEPAAFEGVLQEQRDNIHAQCSRTNVRNRVTFAWLNMYGLLLFLAVIVWCCGFMRFLFVLFFLITYVFGLRTFEFNFLIQYTYIFSHDIWFYQMIFHSRLHFWSSLKLVDGWCSRIFTTDDFQQAGYKSDQS